jgi:hypothetical protein
MVKAGKTGVRIPPTPQIWGFATSIRVGTYNGQGLGSVNNLGWVASG